MFGPDGAIAALGATLICVAAIVVLPALFDRLFLVTERDREHPEVRRRAFERIDPE